MSYSVPGDFPPDPLLASGTFISSAGDGTLGSRAKQRPIQGGIGVSGSGESLRIGMVNGNDQVNPSPDSSSHQADSKLRKRAAPGDNWLPSGWRVEDKVRTSGATAGSVDKVKKSQLYSAFSMKFELCCFLKSIDWVFFD